MPPIRTRRRNRNTETATATIIIANTTKILNLNDDCLLEIFNYLSPVDMCAVKDSCCRFRGLADKRMKSFYKSRMFNLSDTGNQMPFFKFCGVISKLNISLSKTSNRNMELSIFSNIQKYNPKLDTLTLSAVNFELAHSRLYKTLPNLQKIKLEYFDPDYFQYDIKYEEVIKSIFKSCKNIEQISFGARQSSMGSPYQCIFLQQKFKKLRSLELRDVREIDLNNLKLFFKINPNLETITLRRSIRLRDLSTVNFEENCPNIKGISLQFCFSDHAIYQSQLRWGDALCKFENIKYLALDTCCKTITDVITKLAQANSLDYLSLTNVIQKVNNGFAEAFCNMTNLKILRLDMFNHPLSEPHFYKILLTNLVNLMELHLRRDEMFKDVLDIIENARNLEKLYLSKMGDIYNEENFLMLVEARLRKNGVCQLTIFIDNEEYILAVQLIPKNILNENDHLIRLAINFSHLDDYWLPFSTGVYML